VVAAGIGGGDTDTRRGGDPRTRRGGTHGKALWGDPRKGVVGGHGAVVGTDTCRVVGGLIGHGQAGSCGGRDMEMGGRTRIRAWVW
jgi:hypothetical protein